MSKYSNICFYGGGAWGQALSITLASLGHKSKLIVSDQTRANEINSGISRRFSQIKLSPFFPTFFIIGLLIWASGSNGHLGLGLKFKSVSPSKLYFS